MRALRDGKYGFWYWIMRLISDSMMRAPKSRAVVPGITTMFGEERNTALPANNSAKRVQRISPFPIDEIDRLQARRQLHNQAHRFLVDSLTSIDAYNLQSANNMPGLHASECGYSTPSNWKGRRLLSAPCLLLNTRPACQHRSGNA